MHSYRKALRLAPADAELRLDSTSRWPVHERCLAAQSAVFGGFLRKERESANVGAPQLAAASICLTRFLPADGACRLTPLLVESVLIPVLYGETPPLPDACCPPPPSAPASCIDAAALPWAELSAKASAWLCLLASLAHLEDLAVACQWGCLLEWTMARLKEHLARCCDSLISVVVDQVALVQACLHYCASYARNAPSASGVLCASIARAATAAIKRLLSSGFVDGEADPAHGRWCTRVAVQLVVIAGHKADASWLLSRSRVGDVAAELVSLTRRDGGAAVIRFGASLGPRLFAHLPPGTLPEEAGDEQALLEVIAAAYDSDPEQCPPDTLARVTRGRLAQHALPTTLAVALFHVIRGVSSAVIDAQLLDQVALTATRHESIVARAFLDLFFTAADSGRLAAYSKALSRYPWMLRETELLACADGVTVHGPLVTFTKSGSPLQLRAPFAMLARPSSCRWGYRIHTSSSSEPVTITLQLVDPAAKRALLCATLLWCPRERPVMQLSFERDDGCMVEGVTPSFADVAHGCLKRVSVEAVLDARRNRTRLTFSIEAIARKQAHDRHESYVDLERASALGTVGLCAALCTSSSLSWLLRE